MHMTFTATGLIKEEPEEELPNMSVDCTPELSSEDISALADMENMITLAIKGMSCLRVQGLTKALSDSLGLVKRPVGLETFYRRLRTGKQHLLSLSHHWAIPENIHTQQRTASMF